MTARAQPPLDRPRFVFTVDLVHTRAHPPQATAASDGQGSYNATLRGAACAAGSGPTPDAALDHLAARLREWIEDCDAERDEYGYPDLEQGKDRVNQHDESPIVGDLRAALRADSLRALLGPAAAPL